MISTFKKDLLHGPNVKIRISGLQRMTNLEKSFRSGSHVSKFGKKKKLLQNHFISSASSTQFNNSNPPLLPPHHHQSVPSCLIVHLSHHAPPLPLFACRWHLLRRRCFFVDNISNSQTQIVANPSRCRISMPQWTARHLIRTQTNTTIALDNKKQLSKMLN